MAHHDWNAWHEGYDRADSSLAARLTVVRERIRVALDQAPDGRLTVLSLCAGQGRDLLPVLDEHRRRDDVTARLVESDPLIAETARTAAAEAGLSGVEVITGDAGLTDRYLDLAPADLVIACGVFGNISDGDVRNTITGCASLTKAGGTVIWTRHRRDPDLVPSIEQWFGRTGFSKLFLTDPAASSWCVGVHRQDRTPTPLASGEKLFTFLTTPGWTKP